MRKLLLLCLTLCLPVLLSATDGMWLPLLLENLNEEEMKGLGMKISAKDIYDINNGSLKDAIVHFGGFCTGEVISDQGLVLTNHHCGYGAIQANSTLENNLLQDGFWAQTKADERRNDGLYVMFIDRIEDVSDRVLRGVTDQMDDKERDAKVAENLATVRKLYKLKAFEELIIKPFYAGNQYFAFVTKRYTDIRLVGAPPSSIGKYGADTDNWEWPRHTGDFSLFRIYADRDGNPADYSVDNVPYQPKKHLKISMKGVKPGDFSMIFGFPGRTDQYLPASAMQQRTEIINPIRIGMRDRSLAVIDSAMRADPAVRLNYASKQARIANAWKKWRGESEGLEAVNGLEKRREFEAEYRKRAAGKAAEADRYTGLLDKMDRIVAGQEEYAVTRAYAAELNYNIDLFRIASLLRRAVNRADNNGIEAFKKYIPNLINYFEGFYEGYNAEVDLAVAKSLLAEYYAKVPVKHQAFYVRDQKAFAGGVDQMVDDLFYRSYLMDGDRLLQLMRQDPEALLDVLKGDPAYQFVYQLNQWNEKRVVEPYNSYQERNAPLARQYMQALINFFPERRFYPDANSTMRVSYGQFEGFTGLDGKKRDHMTYLDGVIAKYVPGDYEFDLPAKLVELHEQKDYGKYATKDGKLPVCVLGSNHTTGGNSGSPALNADGHLVGLNFDRTWQSTMSDINYDPSICRNIMVDVRYVLFLIDKLGGAPHLVEEMELVR